MQKYGWVVLVLICLASWMVDTAAGQLIVNPSTRAEAGKFEAGGAASFGRVEYDAGYVERKCVGGYGAYGITDWIDAYGSLGFSFDAEPENWSESGHGYILAAGARAKVWQMDDLSALLYGQIQHLKETYDAIGVSALGVDGDLEGKITELIFGALLRYDLNDAFSFYGGVELIPWSDGEIEGSTEVEIPGLPDFGFSDADEVERDVPVTLRAGANYDFGQVWVRGEVALVSETAVTVGGGINF